MKTVEHVRWIAALNPGLEIHPVPDGSNVDGGLGVSRHYNPSDRLSLWSGIGTDKAAHVDLYDANGIVREIELRLENASK